MEDYIMHYGVGHLQGGHSGRFPWGSGDSPFQHSGDFLSRVEIMRKDGLTDKEIAEDLNMTVSDLRSYKSIAKDERTALQISKMNKYKEEGLNRSEISRKLGVNESTLRTWEKVETAERISKSRNVADFLKERVDDKKFVDIGAGTELQLHISKGKLDNAVKILQGEGYKVYGIGVPQITNPGQQTNIMVLCPPGTEHKDVYQARKDGKIYGLENYITIDGGRTFESKTFRYPESLDSSRVQIKYAEEGGVQKDGVIELRRGVKDLDLGKSRYAQVRILVDGTHYLKGMAMYKDDMPEGIDVIFNTNKKVGTPKEKVFKKISDDPDNPFGSYISAEGQSTYFDGNGKERLSLINKVREEGDWDKWSKTLSSQFLGKQRQGLIKQQLDLTYKDKLAEYEEICSLTNPTIKRNLLKSFADDCDSASVHLKAKALPRQRAQVILPVNSISEKEIFAPNFRDGEHVCLVRYPHGGTFEIPELVVNNKNKEAISIFGGKDIRDAVAINSKVAERLSGADFDGDTVVVIPTNDRIKITTSKPLKGLEGFDSKDYAFTDAQWDYEKDIPKMKGVKVMSDTQNQMGRVSNLITDMTLKGAPPEDIAKAVRHSMVVIDAEKHKLDYKKSYIDNDIAYLKERYQKHIGLNGKESTGASTLLSRAKAQYDIPERQGSPRIDPETGEKIFKESNGTHIDKKTGKIVPNIQKSTQMAEVKDAHELSSGTVAEELYANYANSMKALANQARKEYISTPRLEYHRSAAIAYSDQVKSLKDKLERAELNSPKERRAQILAHGIVESKIKDNPELKNKENKDLLNKIRQQAISISRVRVGASSKDVRISIDDREWEAIQAGAIHDTTLERILVKTDADALRERATPRTKYGELSPSNQSRIKALHTAGYSTSEIADALGVSTSTVYKYL